MKEEETKGTVQEWTDKGRERKKRERVE